MSFFKNVPARFQGFVKDFLWETNLEIDLIDDFKVVNGRIYLDFSTEEGHKGSASFYALTSPHHPQRMTYSWHNVCWVCGASGATSREFAQIQLTPKYCQNCFCQSPSTLAIDVPNQDKNKIQSHFYVNGQIKVTSDLPALPSSIWRAIYKIDENWVHFKAQ